MLAEDGPDLGRQHAFQVEGEDHGAGMLAQGVRRSSGPDCPLQ
jgi:hypothetical protein